MLNIQYIELICGVRHSVSICILDETYPAWMGWFVTDDDVNNMKSYLNGLNTDELVSFFRAVFAHAKPKLDVMLKILGELQYTKDNYSFVISSNKGINSYILNSSEATIDNMIILLNENLTLLQLP